MIIKKNTGEKSVKMWITERDLELMRWINEFGFVTINHICRWLQVGKPAAYARVRKLIQRGLLLHQRIFQNQPGIYRVSHMGVKVCHSPIGALNHVSIATLRHNLKVVEISLCLVNRWKGKFVTERQQKQEAGLWRKGGRGHQNDGTLILPDKRIAIEVELSMKGKVRLEKIFEHHYKNTAVDETWYFCGNMIIERKIKALSEKVNFIQVYLLDQFL